MLPHSDNPEVNRSLAAHAAEVADSVRNPPTFIRCGDLEVSGVTLRDYFAASALPSLIVTLRSTEQITKQAFAIADAMLAARGKK